MSMFHELMMRKKEETLYPVIKGSLTDTDGIISGFINTGANYLQIDNMNKLSSVNSWEITIKIISSSGSYFIGTNLERILTISAGTSKVYISSNGSSWDIANGIGLNTSIPNDSYVRLRFTGTQYILDYSSDLTNWTNCATITSSTKISNAITSLVIGKWWTGNVNFTGSIDLNNSYIKLDSTKYKLQAVVGYTVVGSPTITDGVVSGFSASDYVKLSQSIDFNTNFNITIKFRYSATTSGIQAIFSNSAKLYIYIASNGRLYARTQHNNSWDITISTTSALSVDTDYILSFIKNGNDYSLILNGTEIGTQTSSNSIDTSLYPATFGLTTASDVFTNGSIDMNETCIKINNKLWFNGQQA